MPDYETCWLCGRNGSSERLERHHIFGGPYRDKSEQYGLVVYLCGNSCHRLGKDAAHRSAETRSLLRQYGQKKAMAEQGWTVDEFRAVFGKNYLEEGETDGEI